MSILVCSSILATSAKSTELFDSEINFNGGKRKISFIIPDTYADSVKHQLMVCLHGQNDNAKNYASLLYSNGNWDEIADNCIYVFPDGGDDKDTDFYEPTGDVAIIDSAIQFMNEKYNIYQDSIIFQGFGLGGRAALKYTLDNPSNVAGLILNSPSMQGPLDVDNNEECSLVYNYNNANLFPISITNGLADSKFIKQINRLADSLVVNNSNLLLFKIPGGKHIIPQSDYIIDLVDFIRNNSTKVQIPVIHSVKNDVAFYDENAEINVRVLNPYIEAINNIAFIYSLDDKNIDTLEFETEILATKYKDFIIPFTGVTNGYHEGMIHISKINGKEVAANSLFNEEEFYWNTWKTAQTIPFTEPFSDANHIYNNWTFEESGNYISWLWDSRGNKNSGSMNIVNHPFYFYNMGLTEKLYTTKLNMTTAERPAISFDIAYRYTIFDNGSESNNYMDTVQIFISNDNWATEKSIFKKWGDSLLTFDTPLNNPTNIKQYTYTPAPKDWENIIIELTKEDVSDSTLFRIDCISGTGGYLFIDNFFAHDLATTGIKREKFQEVSIYPNPVTNNNSINISFENKAASIVDIELVDVSGKKISDLYSQYTNSGMNEVTLQLPQLNSGIYFVKINNGKNISFEKVIIK
jgi:enterochelin esterase-like enzyme